MIFIFVVVTLLVPSLVESCCWPDRFSATNYRAGDAKERTFSVDFKMNRWVIKPKGHSTLDFVMHDMDAEKQYFKFLDGSCVVRSNVEAGLGQCLSNYHRSWGVTTLPGGSEVESYGITTAEVTSVQVMTKVGCKPVFTSVITATANQVNVYTDLVTSVDNSVIQPDVSMCTPAPDDIGRRFARDLL